MYDRGANQAQETGPFKGLFTTYVLVLSLLLTVFGGVLLVASSNQQGSQALVLSSIASALISAGVVSLVWDLLASRWSKEEQKRELSAMYDILEQRLAKTQENFLRAHYDLEEGAQNFGLRSIVLHRLPSKVVREAMSKANSLLMCCVIDSDWRDRYFESLVSFLRRGGELTAYIPDTSSDEVVAELARLFGRDVSAEVDALVGALGEAMREAGLPSSTPQVAIRRPQQVPAYTCFRWQAESGDPSANFGILRVYGNRIQRGNVLPALMFTPGGLIWDFVDGDLPHLSPDLEVERAQ